MVYGVISLIAAQLLILALTATAYLRIRSQSDMEKHDRMTWGIKVEAAVATADGARRMVDTIEVSHYKALQAKFEAQNLEIAELKKEVFSLRNEVQTLRTKNASDARTERRQKERESGVQEIAQVLAEAQTNGQAFPIPAPAPAAPRPFGKIP